jgi:hypothetical protein
MSKKKYRPYKDLKRKELERECENLAELSGNALALLMLDARLKELPAELQRLKEVTQGIPPEHDDIDYSRHVDWAMKWLDSYGHYRTHLALSRPMAIYRAFYYEVLGKEPKKYRSALSS